MSALLIALTAAAGSPDVTAINDVDPSAIGREYTGPGQGMHTMAMWDTVMGPFAVPDTWNLGVEFDGTYFYATDAGGRGTVIYGVNVVQVLDTTGALVDWHPQGTSSSWGWRDIAWDELRNRNDDGITDTLYSSDSPVVATYGIDPGNIYNYGTFSGPENPNRALAHDPASGSFWTANFSGPIYEFDKSGTIGSWSNSYAIYGAAYDDGDPAGPWVWFAAQEANAYGNNNNIYQWDPGTNAYTGVFFEVPSYMGGSGEIAGGLAFYSGWYGLDILCEMVQAPQDYIICWELRVTTGTGENPKQTTPFNLKLNPNPAGERSAATFALSAAAEGRVALYNASGRLVFEKTALFDAGQNSVILPTESLAKGVYLLQAGVGGQTGSATLVVK